MKKHDLNGLISALDGRRQPPPRTASRDPLQDLHLLVPEGWQQVVPSGSMRIAEYHMAGARPHDPKATLAVFAGKMGSVEANIDRWIGQFTQPDGSATISRAKRWQKTVDGMPVVLVDIPGTYAPNMGMGQGANTAPEPNYRMLGAIVNYGPQFFYFKLIGPNETVALWTSSFETFITNIKKT